MPWYDLKPAQYAEGLRYSADRSDESAAHKAAEGKPWSPGEAEHYTRQARRLRAMAILCDQSKAERAGAIDFRRLHDPSIPRELEDSTVAEIEASASPKGRAR